MLLHSDAPVSQVVSPRPRMGLFVDLHQPPGVDLGIGLRRRQRGVAEKFLHRAQIAAIGQKMGRKGMAQGMRRGAFATGPAARASVASGVAPRARSSALPRRDRNNGASRAPANGMACA